MKAFGSSPTGFLWDSHRGAPCGADDIYDIRKLVLVPPTEEPCTQANFQEAAESWFSPEEKTQGAHVSQVHAEHAAGLLQGTRPLRLVPARGLQEAIAVREPQVGVCAGGGAGEAGHVMVTRLCPSSPGAGTGRVWGKPLKHAHQA